MGLYKVATGRDAHYTSSSHSDNMGNFLYKTIDNYEERICDLSKTITTAHSYDRIISEMFDDGKFNIGRVEVWYIMSCVVRDHMSVEQHPLLDHYFWKWMTVFVTRLPREKRPLQIIKESWWKTGTPI